MKTSKRDNKIEEIKVLDKGKNFDGPIIVFAFCCAGLAIPFRS